MKLLVFSLFPFMGKMHLLSAVSRPCMFETFYQKIERAVRSPINFLTQLHFFFFFQSLYVHNFRKFKKKSQSESANAEKFRIS